MRLNGISFALLGVTAALLSGCPVGPQWQEALPPLFEELAYRPLVDSLVTATAAGYHRHLDGDGESAIEIQLDQLLDDYSARAISDRVSYYKDFEARLHGEKSVSREAKGMSRDFWINYGIAENRVKRALFSYERERPFAHDPNFYVELLGGALLIPITLEYDSERKRYGHVNLRLAQAPYLFAQAKTNLIDSSDLARDAAKAETLGLIELVRESIPESLPDELVGPYETAAEAAIAALEDYAAFLDALPTDSDWRFGAELFEEKVRVSTDVSVSIDETLAQLQAEFDQTYARLIETAKPIHRKI